MKLKIFIRKFHRWLSIIIGIQITFWVISGAYFTIVPLKTVRGEDRMNLPNPPVLPQADLASPSHILRQYPGITRLNLEHSGDSVVYACYFNEDLPQFLLDAATGEKLPPKDPTEILTFAQADYGEGFESDTVKLMETAPPEYAGPLPVYQVAVSDTRKTRLYLSPVTGEVLKRRNRYWRIFDFLWMFHIMDFKDRSNFNNNLVRTLAIASMGVVCSGYLLWVTSRRRKKTRLQAE